MHVIDTSTRSSPTDRRRLHYGNCTRGLGRSSRMLSAGALTILSSAPGVALRLPWAKFQRGQWHRGIYR